MKRMVTDVPIEAMAIINPKFCKNRTIQVELEQNNEGPIPHLHVYHDKTRNPKKCSYVRLDRAEYSPHHEIVAMPKNVKDEFVELMNSTWEKEASTGYEAAVNIWVDTFEEDYSKFSFDASGKIVMPNYEDM